MITKINNLKKIVILFTFFFSITLFAQTKLASFFNDNMVLQRNESVAIWGHDAPGIKIRVSGSWEEEATVKTNKEGVWKLNLQTPDAGGPYSVVIQGSEKITLKNVLIGEVWLCSGQSNMWMPLKGYNNSGINGNNETILNSKNNRIRFFSTKKEASLKPLEDVSGKWMVAKPSTVVNFSALAYYFGVKLNDILNIPVGLIHTSWGGSKVEAWMDQETLSKFEGVEIPTKVTADTRKNKTPTLLYNAMIHPFESYTIKGFLYYQGESNVSRSQHYTKLFSSMIGLWREKWERPNMPFYFVQIAPFGYGKRNSAFLREAQMRTMQTVDNTGMVVTLDIGDCKDIHPAEKELIGNRLAYWALAKNYGIKGISYSGPIYRSMEKTSDGKIKIAFDFCENGLTSFGKPLIGFEIAGEDKIFYTARAQINGDKSISVSSQIVKKPVAVRYAFGNCSKASLFNTGGLPASSFRTDNWTETKPLNDRK